MKETDIKSHMSWVVPTVVTICIVIYHLMYAVKTAQKFDRIITEDTRIIAELDARIDRLEEFCCSEISEFKNTYGSNDSKPTKRFLGKRLNNQQ